MFLWETEDFGVALLFPGTLDIDKEGWHEPKQIQLEPFAKRWNKIIRAPYEHRSTFNMIGESYEYGQVGLPIQGVNV